MPLDSKKLADAIKHTENQEGTIAMRRECGACHGEFVTVKSWEKRCELCRAENKPYTKRVFNKSEVPF